MRTTLAAICFLVCFLCFPCWSMAEAIYVDEGFEGPQAFADQDWPVSGADAVPTSATIAVKGINLRHWDDANASRAKIMVLNTATISSNRSFKGTKSLRLVSGQSIKVDGPFDQLPECSVLQFAVSTDEMTAGLAVGTEVGRLTLDWSANTTDTLETSTTISFRMIDEKRESVGLFLPGQHSHFAAIRAPDYYYWPMRMSWVLLSIIINKDVSSTGGNSPAIWCSFDPIAGKYKGPEPQVLTIPPTVVSPAETERRRMNSGLCFYTSSNSSNTLSTEKIAAGWGSDGDDSNGAHNTRLLGWEFSAQNGGVLFIDDIYWDTIGHSDPTQGINQEAAARMKNFCEHPQEPFAYREHTAAGEEWALYE